MPVLLRPAVNRPTALADQLLSSAQNFAVVLIVARAVNAHGFGQFSVALVLYTLVVGLSQSAVGEPALLTFHRLSAYQQRRAGLACMTAGFAVGATAGVLLLLGSLLMPPGLASCVRVLSFALPLLLAHDCGRFAFIAAGRSAQALIADSAWILVWAVWVVLAGTPSAAAGLAAWGFSSAAGAAFGVLALGPGVPGLQELTSTLGSDRPLRLRLIGEYLSVSAGSQLTVLGFSAAAGLTIGGGVRAAQSLLGPLNTMFNAIRVITTPEAAKRFRRSGVVSAELPLKISAALVGVAVLTGGVALLLPDAVGRQLLGDTWTVAHRVMPVIVAHRLLAASVIGPLGMLRAAGQAGPLMVRRGTAEIAGGILCVVVTILAGPWWGVGCMLLAPAMDTTLSWALLLRTRRQQRLDVETASPSLPIGRP